MKKIFIIAIIIVVLLLLEASVSKAATYYVDFNDGNDSNNGTSTSTPFKHSPGDDLAIGTADITILSHGDSVILKGGIIYTGEIDIDWSGSLAGGYITYDGDSGTIVPRWGLGTDKAKID